MLLQPAKPEVSCHLLMKLRSPKTTQRQSHFHTDVTKGVPKCPPKCPQAVLPKTTFISTSSITVSDSIMTNSSCNKIKLPGSFVNWEITKSSWKYRGVCVRSVVSNSL